MRPRVRYLKGNKGTEGPTSMLFFDTESWMEKRGPSSPRTEGRLRLWVAQYVRREGDTFRPPVVHRGRTAEGFLSLLESLSSWRRPLWVFAHNLGHDLTQVDFWSALESKRWTAGPVERPPNPRTGKPRAPWRGRLCVEGRPTYLVVRGRWGTLKMVDTFNYWASGLDKIGESFGIPKLAKPDFNGDEGPLWPYCERDVDCCRVAVTELIRYWIKEDCGTFQATGGMLAETNFRHTCSRRTKDGQAVAIVKKESMPGRELERAAYLGGRIEPFYVGELAGPIYHLDCNGNYGHVLCDRLYPRKHEGRLRNPTPEKLLRKMHAFGAIADVRIATKASSDTYPVKHLGVQYHACGQFWTTLAGPELWRALTAGHVAQVGECHLYSLADLFTDWCRTWLNRVVDAKKRGDKAQAEFAKLMYKALPGKFGQRADYWRDDKSRACDPNWGPVWRYNRSKKKVVQWRSIAGHVQRRDKGKESWERFPAISAYVTSNAREYMRSIFVQMPEGSLLYTATDSIICTQAGFDAISALGLIDPWEPGKFAIKGVHAKAEICGPNWYRLDDQWVASGLWGKSRPDGDGNPVCDVWDQLPTLLRSNPHGRCGYTTYPLKAIRPTEKNEPGPGGWRRPKRLSFDFDFSDRPPRLRPAVVKAE